MYDQARIIWAKSEGSSDKNFELHRVNPTRMGFGTLSPGQWKTGLQNQRFYWEVKAVRADIAPLEVEKKY